MNLICAKGPVVELTDYCHFLGFCGYWGFRRTVGKEPLACHTFPEAGGTALSAEPRTGPGRGHLSRLQSDLLVYSV